MAYVFSIGMPRAILPMQEAKLKTFNQSSATENAMGNAGGNLTSCHMLQCSALPSMHMDLFRGATCWMAPPP